MASMAQLIGRRPAQASLGASIGKALEGAGNYYGEVAIQKRNAEALEESRNYQEGRDELKREQALGDLENQRDYAEGITASTRAYEEGLTDEERAHAATLTAEQREYNATQQAERDLYNEGVTDDNRLYEQEMEDNQRSYNEGRYSETMTLLNEEGVPTIYHVNDSGDKVEVGADPDYVKGSDGAWGRASAGSKSAPKVTEAQAKYKLHARNMDNATRLMTQLIGSQGDYDLRSPQAFFDQVSAVGGNWGNWVTSSDGRKYLATQKMAGESLYKAMSGAAGSDAEAQRFYSMFPAFGDDHATAQLKLGMVSQVIANLEEASGSFGDDPDLMHEIMIQDWKMTALENGFDLESGTLFDSSTKDSAPANDLGLSQDDLDWMNGGQTQP